jgi:ATP-binding cassette subfamily B protein
LGDTNEGGRSDPATPTTGARGALRRLLPLVRPQSKRLALACGVALAALAAQVAQPLIVKRIIDDALVGGHRNLLLPLTGVAVAAGLVDSGLRFTRRNIEGLISLSLEYELRNRVYAHLQRLSVAFHDGWQSGQLVSRAINDIAAIRRFIGFGLMWLFIFAAMFVMVVATLFKLDPLLAVTTAAFSLPVAYLANRFGRAYHQISRASQDQTGDLTTIVEESATGVRIIKAFGRMRERSADYKAQATTLLSTQMRGVWARSHFWSLDTMALNANLVLILLIGGLRVAAHRLSLGGLVAFVSYQLMLIWPVRAVGWIIATGQEATTASERVFEVLDTEPRIADLPGAIDLWETSGRIRFEDVSFRYPAITGAPGEKTRPSEGGEPVLSGLDLEIRPGETLALVGMTGSGKTSVALLLPRFYDPSSGRITLDGHDIRSLSVRSLRSHIGVAFEDPILFSASVRENILMGGADAADEEIWDALGIAQAAEFVRELPWGLDTRVGEQGYSLSGGQRQRLALARAILGRPAILVLDDPLSSVDVHTEEAIESALAGILHGHTVVLIAHRPSTLRLADRVALLHDGRVVATGTHHDLLETVPLYRSVLAKATEEKEQVHA